MARRFITRDGRRTVLRPVEPGDAAALQAFFAALSAGSRRGRFHGADNGVGAAYANYLCRVDGRSAAAFVAISAAGTIVAEARWRALADGRSAEFTVVVADAWTRIGLAQGLIGLLVASARSAGLRGLRGDVVAGNGRMLALMQHCGFALRSHPEGDGMLRAELGLGAGRGTWRRWLHRLRRMLRPRVQSAAARGASRASTLSAWR